MVDGNWNTSLMVSNGPDGSDGSDGFWWSLMVSDGSDGL